MHLSGRKASLKPGTGRTTRALVLVALAATLLTLPAATQAATFRPTDDTFTRASQPNRNFDGSTRLPSQRTTAARSYLKFDVRGIEGDVTGAVLQLQARRPSGRKGVTLHPVRSNQWRESALTHRNAPPVKRAIDRARNFGARERVRLDASELVDGNGEVSLAIGTSSRRAVIFRSRETGRHAPRLIVREAPDRPGDTTETPPPRPAGQFNGVNMHPLWSNTSVADFDRELDMAQAAGVDTVRIDISWSSLEQSGKGDYAGWYVDKADTFFEHAQDRGIEVIPVLWSTPCWASSAPADVKDGCSGAWWDRDVHLYPPRDASDYADAAAWVSRRWGQHFRAIEIWNEPNLEYSFVAPDPAAAYARILKTAYPRIKAVDPQLTVLGGAMAFADGGFLRELYAHGIRGSYDAISFHPYNEWRDPDDLWQPEWKQYTYQTGTRWMREIMVARGDAALDLWITETGFSTCSEGSSRWCVTEAEQAEYTEDNYRIAREWPYVRSVISYNLRNKGTARDDRESQFGLVERDFTPKPGYYALKRALAN